jgi:hypothetical protein
MTRNNPGSPLFVFTAFFCLSIFLFSAASPAGAEPEKGKRVKQPSLTLSAAPFYQFDGHLDKGGKVSSFSTQFAVDGSMPLSKDLTLGLNCGYTYSDYSFTSPVTFAGSPPWDTLHTLKFGGRISYDLTPDWSAALTSSIQIAREEGADWGKAILYGGTLSASHRFSPHLTVGIGIAAFSELEKVQAYPLLVINWRISDRLSLANPFRPGPSSPAGLELSYRIADGWEVATGAAYRSERFRLRKTGPVPDGIGQSRSVPVWIRISRNIDERFNLDIYGGILLGGKLSLDDRRGNRLVSEDYDTAPMLGLAAAYRF